MPDRPLTNQERSKLLRFEVLYERWRTAQEDFLAAESRLWAEAVRLPQGEERERLATEALQLRSFARDAYAQLVALLEESDR